MTAPTTAAPSAPRAPDSGGEQPARSAFDRPVLHRPAVIAVVLLAVYFACTLITDAGGYLSTDTGGKVATLDAMVERGDLRPDLGYWAEQVDPDGSLYPMFRTLEVNGQWVNTTSMPMIYLALPLYRLGGYTLALLVPMLGGVATAWAAGRVSRQLSGRGATAVDDRLAASTMLWIGVATPIAVYSLDLWEHTLGVALMMWAVSWILDLAASPRVVHGIGAGLAFGAAATMRQEALVYGVVAGLIVLWLGVRRRRVVALLPAAAMATSAVLALVGGVLLETAAMGASLRTGRSAGTAASSGGRVMLRLHEAVVTLGSINQLPIVPALVFVVVLIVGFALLTAGSAGTDRTDSTRRGALLIGGAYLVLVVGFVSGGLSFVSGMLLATPLAGIGLTVGYRRAELRLAWVMAVAPLPLVWYFQYTGGAGPQWGGRYILLSGTLLAVVALVELRRHARRVGRALILLSVSITAIGIAWLGQRSTGFASATAELAAREEPVLVFADPHAARESGPVARHERWFAAPTSTLRREAAAAVTELGYDSFGFVSYQPAEDRNDPVEAQRSADRVSVLLESFDGFEAAGTERIPLLPDVELEVITFVRR